MRYFLANDRVRRLVENHLLPLFFCCRSVNALCELLNERLAAKGAAGTVHPNRLHSLLSNDATRSVNEASLSLIESAVAGDEAITDIPSLEEALSSLQQEAARTWHSHGESARTIPQLASELGLPPAAAAFLLRRAGVLNETASSHSPTTPTPGSYSPREKERIPDWGFQDEACRRCMAALNGAPNRKIGLVIPTGGGKTRVALRIALTQLAKSPGKDGNVVWVTHRNNLRTQAHRELQRMLLDGSHGLPEDAATLLAERIEFVMVSQLSPRLSLSDQPPLMVIVDEGHHAAAESYRPVFETSYPLRGLFLTATPNRTDELPIGIDFVAYTITYRELEQRGVILIPEFRDFHVEDFEWTESCVADLADEVIEGASAEFAKILVLAPRLDRVREFYDALVDRLGREKGHVLSADDIGFVHGSGNSIGCGNDEFLAGFRGKPRAILVSAQLLLEGFDDPAINTVVITYPSQSVLRLMQAAGRCVRFSPGKVKAFVLQARNDLLAYHFDQRWLYQEISDELRPVLQDNDYADIVQLQESVRTVLEEHHVSPTETSTILNEIDRIMPGSTCRLMLCGLPYFGTQAAFNRDAPWSALVETDTNSMEFRSMFNDFCARGASAADPSDFLRKYGKLYGFRQDFSEGSTWRTYANMLTAMYRARLEVYEGAACSGDGECRPFATNGATTWLKYITFNYAPKANPELQAFLADCYNGDEAWNAYSQAPSSYGLALKIRLPLGQYEAHLLNHDNTRDFRILRQRVREKLLTVKPSAQVITYTDCLNSVTTCCGLPLSVMNQLDQFLAESAMSAQILDLHESDTNLSQTTS